jgi:hypothetical protein
MNLSAKVPDKIDATTLAPLWHLKLRLPSLLHLIHGKSLRSALLYDHHRAGTNANYDYQEKERISLGCNFTGPIMDSSCDELRSLFPPQQVRPTRAR